MYGLADEKLGCRFSVALGLRTLTLQTGDALRERLHLESDDLAVLIGSQAVRQLHELRRESKAGEAEPTPAEQSGSESAESLFAEHQYVRYDGSLDDGRLSQWLKATPSLHQLLSAPVLVSTIDHLMPATEGERGGKQIAPMLRLLTSDLVLDEPDDFDLADLPALCRLVNWAGMLGSRVLLSSATLPPNLIGALFEAYCSGRFIFNASRGNTRLEVCCAWFDEYKIAQSEAVDLAQFTVAHQQFVAQRVSALAKQVALRKAALWPVVADSQSTSDVVQAMSAAISRAATQLHTQHHQTHPPTGKKVSIGLVRMANIKPLVAVTQHLLSQAAPDSVRLHFCIYHSQHPLLVRSEMEQQLDAALTRNDQDQLWLQPAIASALHLPETHQIFIVFATAVAEVGRDHDYDWAVAEPSSMRSLIQLAGRIQRHRQQQPATPNLLILDKNYRALKGESIAYTRPGFESEKFPLASKDLNDILLPAQYQQLSAAPRIQPRPSLEASHNLVDLEHVHLAARLFGTPATSECAQLWWAWQQGGGRNPSWCAELQRRMPFRASGKDEAFVLLLDEEGEQPQFHLRGETGELKAVDQSRFARCDVVLGANIQPWLENDAAVLIEDLADRLELTLSNTSQKFAEIRLRESQQQWRYHRWFGVYEDLF
ncbi:type I-F CRISPR-associated helicase Cas3f [Deefgea sp. CFH1-16]|uniref:type I-F CRISPR-associated helicase Cas3f n=1 Tax=Deefgea sp. CFH1-16 TaxID=2675457 RepID=UPI00194025CC|nr:type I-F CRISPR-associated helicase Cas3f [Deefgea sp. CFH1-16]